MSNPLPQLFGHPFSSYTQKVLIALYENATPFDYRVLEPGQPGNLDEWLKSWPIARFPVLRHEGRVWAESTVIIEYFAQRFPGATRLLPEAADAALAVRQLDRFFDNYVMTPMQKIVLDHRRESAQRDACGVDEAHRQLDSAYAWLDRELAGRPWAAGADFGLADCAAAPALFYADWVHPITPMHDTLRAYRRRLLERPSIARCVEEARPFRSYFPPGAPDRD